MNLFRFSTKFGHSLFTQSSKIFSNRFHTTPPKQKEVLGGSSHSPKEPRARKRHGLTGLGESFQSIKTRALYLVWKRKYEFSGHSEQIDKIYGSRFRRSKKEMTLLPGITNFEAWAYRNRIGSKLSSRPTTCPQFHSISFVKHQ